MGGRASSVAVVGDAALDLYFVLGEGQALDEKTTAVAAHRDLGGTGANAAVAASRLGSAVTLFAAVGTDPLGEWLERLLVERGVGTQGVRRLRGDSPVVAITLVGGQRTVVVDRGVADRLEDVDPGEVVAAGETVYLSAVPLEVARAVGSAIMPDRAGASPTVPEVSGRRLVVSIEERQVHERPDRWRSVLAGADLALMNEAAWARIAGPGTDEPSFPAVITRGTRGLSLIGPAGLHAEFGPFEVAVVDATGAGDCLAGAVCHFLGRGFSLPDAAALGNVAAGLSTAALGAQAALPSEEEVLEAARGAGLAVADPDQPPTEEIEA